MVVDDTTGVIIAAQGCGFCPAARPLLNTWTAAPEWDPRHFGEAAEPAWRHFETKMDQLLPLVLPTNGAPRRAANGGKPGRPPLGGPELPPVWKQTVFCPARAGKCRCPLHEPSMELDKTTVPTVPDQNVPDGQHTLCRQGSAVATYSEQVIK